MWFYLFAFLPILVGLILHFFKKEICWKEWLLGSGIALVVAGIFHLIALGTIHAKTADVETWSGYVTQVEYHPEWVERWRKRHTQTYQCGTTKNPRTCTRTWYTTEYERHREHWEAGRTFGVYHDNVNIPQSLYDEIKKLFGDKIVDGGKQSSRHGGSHHSGDRNIYATKNETGFLYPATVKKHFSNRIKATPNLFQFAKVDEHTNKFLYEWPENFNWNSSDRLLGTARQRIDTLKFDQMNARLGPSKRINVIMIGFQDQPSMFGQYQQAKFIGGKKNDLIIAFSTDREGNRQWVYVFGWTESELVKRNLETILLENPIDDNALPLIEAEIKKNYVKKEWSRFNYIQVAPPSWVYTTYLLLMMLSQGGLYIYFHQRELFSY